MPRDLAALLRVQPQALAAISNMNIIVCMGQMKHGSRICLARSRICLASFLKPYRKEQPYQRSLRRILEECLLYNALHKIWKSGKTDLPRTVKAVAGDSNHSSNSPCKATKRQPLNSKHHHGSESNHKFELLPVQLLANSERTTDKRGT